MIDFDTSTSKTVNNNKISSVNAKNNNSSNNINEDFNLDIDYIQTTTTALIREYLARKGFRDTLEKFDEESPKNENSANISSRSKLIDYLGIQKLHEKNKTLKSPFKSILELLLSYHSAKFLRDIKKTDSASSSTAKMDSKDSQKRPTYYSSSKSKANDLRIDDANEGELYDGNDKRIGSNNLDDDDPRNLSLNINKLKTNLKTSDQSKSSSMTKKASTSSSSSNNSFKSVQQASLSQADKISESMKRTSLANEDSDEDAKFKEALERKKQERKLKDLIDVDETDRRKAKKEESSPRSSNINATQAQAQALDKLTSTSSSNNVNKTGAAASSSTQETSQDYTSRAIDLETARELRILLFGSTMQSFNDEWKIQSFSFCDYAKIKFGIVQKKGGSCGVLACVQAYVLLELIYANDEPPKDLNAIFNVNKKDRSRALAKGIARLLWKCAGSSEEAVIANPSSQAYFPPSSKYKTDGLTETLNLLTFKSFQSLESYLLKNVNLFECDGNSGVILLLYSAIFTRGIKRIKKDMDDESNKLMGMHGYCTQDMVNLLIHGRAVSNVFNDSIYLDSLELRGPNKRNEIGLLSLFEHYKSCEVGSYYKTPKYPIWVVCSESHFSVLFALRKDILSDWKAETRFDLYYYDGLAKQDEQIRLTISSRGYDNTSSNTFIAQLYKNKKAAEKPEKDLTPPLELVIRTKWKDANVNWNGTEPIL